MTLLTRAYLFDVRPAHRETFASYSARVLAANYETAADQAIVIREKTTSKRNVDRDSAWREILPTKARRPQLTFEAHPTGWVQHPDGTSCDTCHTDLPERALCTRCGHGQSVQQYPHFDDLVCVTHRRWVGLTTTDDGQHPVPDSTIRAAHRFRRLRRAGRLDLRLYSTLTAAVREAFTDTTDRHHPMVTISASFAFERVVAIADDITSRSFAKRFFDPHVPFAVSHAHLRSFIARQVDGRGDPAVVTRAVWLYARPTVWAIRHSTITGAPFATQWEHDLFIPRDIAQQFAATARPDEPFDEYLKITGDNLLTPAALAQASNRAVPAATVLSGAKRLSSICAGGHQVTGKALTLKDLRNGRAPQCPVCQKRMIVPGYNDLATTDPDVARQLDTTRNGGLTAAGIGRSSLRKIWWLCEAGHSWDANPSSRVHLGSDCPVCIGRLIQIGVNDLATTHPQIAAEWHPLFLLYSPTSVTFGSEKLVQWRCAQGHDYEMRINDRTNLDECPTCRRKKVRCRADNLVATHPVIGAEWHPTFNGDRLASEYTFGSKEEAYWLCAHGHHYKQRIERRVAGYGCSVCSRRSVVPNVTDFETEQPTLAIEWHPYLNTKKPSRVFAGSNSRHWWLCSAGHKTQQSVPHRILSAGCIECALADRILNRGFAYPSEILQPGQSGLHRTPARVDR